MELKEEVLELKDRLMKANLSLAELSTKGNAIARSHYESKRQGVALALEYMRSVHCD